MEVVEGIPSDTQSASWKIPKSATLMLSVDTVSVLMLIDELPDHWQNET